MGKLHEDRGSPLGKEGRVWGRGRLKHGPGFAGSPLLEVVASRGRGIDQEAVSGAVGRQGALCIARSETTIKVLAHRCQLSLKKATH